MSIREEILADVKRIVEASEVLQGDIFVRDLIESGMDDTAALKYLNHMVKTGKLRKVWVIRNGRGCNAYREVEHNPD